MEQSVWVITGPTASGKSALAMNIAMQYHCEIVCMDSMQIYRGMNVGTAKPTKAEQQAVPHHMLDIVSPRDEYSVSLYQKQAEDVIQGIFDRENQPLLVGGTGFYLRALRNPMALGDTAADASFREEMEHVSVLPDGPDKLHTMLEAVDPVTANRLHKNDVRRVIRALEVYHVTGKPFSAQRKITGDARYSYRVVALDMDRNVLYERIHERIERMLEEGLVEEVKGLLAEGVPADAQSMQGIGYKEVIPFIRGEITRIDMENVIRLNTRHYAKRQLTWMRHEGQVQWVNPLNPDAAEQTIRCFQSTAHADA